MSYIPTSARDGRTKNGDKVMTKKAKKIHPTETRDRDFAMAATSFNVHLRLSPTKKINEDCRNILEAISVRDIMMHEYAKSLNGRQAMIYALNDSGQSVMVPLTLAMEMQAEAFDLMPDTLEMPIPVPAAEAYPDLVIPPTADQTPIPAPKVGKRSKAAKALAKAPTASAEKPAGKRAAAKAEAEAAADRGEIPTTPDFTPPSHAPFRKKLAKIVAMVEAGDLAGLKADPMEPKSSSRVMICRYRDLAIRALGAR